MENITRPYCVLLKPSTWMKTNDEVAKKVNSPPYDAADSAENARNVGLPQICSQVRNSVAGRSACGFSGHWWWLDPAA